MTTITAQPLVCVATLIPRMIDERVHVLLGQRKAGRLGGGMWGTPAGRLEFGENLRDAAKREVLEECGLTLHFPPMQLWTGSDVVNDEHFVCVYHHSRWWDETFGEPKVCEPEKCDGWVWYDIDALPENTFPTVKQALNRAKYGMWRRHLLDPIE